MLESFKALNHALTRLQMEKDREARFLRIEVGEAFRACTSGVAGGWRGRECRADREAARVRKSARPQAGMRLEARRCQPQRVAQGGARASRGAHVRG